MQTVDYYDKNRKPEKRPDTEGPGFGASNYGHSAGRILILLQVAGDEEVYIDSAETTGEDDFKYEQAPHVRAVVVDQGSAGGFVQITGGNKPRERIQTGEGNSGYVKRDILAGQSCMLYGRPTVIYIRPKP